jgi:hypothetical protein
MASLTITLTNTSSVTKTLAQDSQQYAQLIMQSIGKNGGITVDNGDWYPVNAILQVSINL